MCRHLPWLTLLIWTMPVHAAGLLVPEEKTVLPLAMLDHHVTIQIEDQVAQTKVEQTFRNHTDRPLEATYIFPVPRGASVRGFSMSVNGQQTKGELLEAAKASQIYTDIVRRTMDPGLLEYMGNTLLRMKVFPVPARGDVKVIVQYTSVAGRAGGAVEYIYPLRSEHKATRTLGKFTIKATLKSQHRIQNIYSPSHA
ncbi:MAG TPA: VIT domain-containing protein, partial [Gemmataceae bacterium]|nr:VIT domain-containing protein [Gemmataceae bacterium]